MRIDSIGVVGGGAWGTALAHTLCADGRNVVLWARDRKTVEGINSQRENRTHLPGVRLDPRLVATDSLPKVAACDAALMVVPAQHMRGVARLLAPLWRRGTPVVSCAKGIEQGTARLMSDVLAEEVPAGVIAALSGPSFAADVAGGKPAALTLACRDEAIGEALAIGLGSPQLRLYWSSDLAGVELGGAVKNVLAIAAGIVEGRGLGASAHAALVTRGFSELRRFGTAFGARPETLFGLSGLGDLVLTCGSAQSRNMSLGRALGQGRSLQEVLGARTAVTEGVHTAAAVARLARERSIAMPISAAVDGIIAGSLSIDDAIAALLQRPRKAED